MLDVLFLCHGRLEFTRASLTSLSLNTEWALVNELVVYNDAATDGAETTEFVELILEELGGNTTLRQTNLGSPVAVMNHFLYRSEADVFAKIDNDVVVCDLWLSTLATVMENNPELDLLGMQPGMGGVPPDDWNMRSDADQYGFKESDHIGGVGMMRRSAFDRNPPPVANGRFGFTEWQHQHRPKIGWVSPDIHSFCLDFLPIEPWAGLTERYIKEGLNRVWPKYDPAMSAYWEWWL